MASSLADSHGPYPDNWTNAARDLWDAEPLTYRGYETSEGHFVEVYSETEWEALQEAFERGWLIEDANGRIDLSPDDRRAARDDYFTLTTTLPEGFDWDAYRDYLVEERYETA